MLQYQCPDNTSIRSIKQYLAGPRSYNQIIALLVIKQHYQGLHDE